MLSQTVCRAPYITREGKASLASPGGGQGGRVKRKQGFDFPDKAAAAAAPSHLPAQRMSPGYLQVVYTCGAAGGACGRSCCEPRAAASHLLRSPSAPGWSLRRGMGRARRLPLQLPPWSLRGAAPPRPVSSEEPAGQGQLCFCTGLSFLERQGWIRAYLGWLSLVKIWT